MGSSSMDVEDQSGGSWSNTVLPIRDQVSLHAVPRFVNGAQFKDQFTSGDDYAPKVRKPYTITKQRERWTEEEHKKFLEALKLYGRAWRRIEEHVGSKTAVQIRSHAQKFFSKVVRESSGSDTSSVKPIEIPPPRPKRKPMHPYPRKLVSPFKTGIDLPEQQQRSNFMEQENQSPTSVLSAVGSDVLGTVDSSSPRDSPSPVSSSADVKSGDFIPSEPNLSPEEKGSSSPAPQKPSSTSEEQVPVKLELFPQDNGSAKEGSAEAGSIQSLKLFGKTVLVTDSYKPSSPINGTGKPLPPYINNERSVQTLPWNSLAMKHSPENGECTWSALRCGAPAAYYMQIQNGNFDQVEAGSAAALPWWNHSGGVSYPFLQVHSPVPAASNPSSDDKAKELQKEGSLTGSNTGSVNAGGDVDANWDVETQSSQLYSNKEENEPRQAASFKRSDAIVFTKPRATPNNSRRGFVPYKRCLAERDTNSSSVTVEEREEQRIWLCL